MTLPICYLCGEELYLRRAWLTLRDGRVACVAHIFDAAIAMARQEALEGPEGDLVRDMITITLEER